MDPTTLAQKLLEWQAKAIELQDLEDEIKAAVLEAGKTQVVGRARATFYNPRKSYDYQAAADGHPMVNEATISLFTQSVVQTTTDWKGICEHAGIEDIPFTESPARVALKLEKD